MKEFSIVAFFMCCVLLIVSCAPMPVVEPTQKSNLTVGMVKTKIVKGETNQADVLELFGAPNLVTINQDEYEVWNYNRMSFKTGSGEAGDVWLGSRALSTSTTSSFDLIITFDENDVVKDYSMISSSY
ncbi:MAG: hypothetical protein V3U24_00005 [Candidatus Neomarinimicrobiota bacterium]